MSGSPWDGFTAEQRRAAFLVDRPMLAAAGAGAGKTAVMAVRYCACLLDRDGEAALGPERILAVAFTREAAANLRARIDRTLRAVLRRRSFPRLDGENGERELGEAEVGHLAAALAALPGAPIDTFDALCLQWAGEHAALLGRDPRLRIQEDLAWAQAQDAAWASLRGEQAASPAGELLELAEAYGEWTVRAAVRALALQAAALPVPRLSAWRGDAPAELRRHRAAQLAAIDAALRAGLDSRPGGKTGDDLHRLALLADHGSPAWLAALSELRVPGGSKNEELKEAVVLIQNALDYPTLRNAEGKRPEAARRVRFASLAALARGDDELERRLARRAGLLASLAMAWLARLDEAAERAGLAGFARVEADALRLLGDPAAQRRLGRRYRHILLDEAQDLNRLQGRIVERIQHGGEDRGGARVFVVGDHRQSIFGFRHAEPAIFAGWERDIGGRGGAVADLAHNFRSHPELLGAVKELFAQPALSGEFRPEGIVAGRAAADFAHPARLACWRIEARRDGQPLALRRGAAEGSDAMARHIAALISASLAAGRRPEDHAILLRSRTRMRRYAVALEQAGIAYDTDFPGGLYDAQECHDVEAVIRLCLDPHDRRALAIALGGPWGGDDPRDRRLMVEALELEPAAAWRLAAERTPLGTLVDGLRPVLAGEGVAAALRRLVADPLLTARYGRLPLARRRLANLASLAAEEERAGVPLDGHGLVARLAERRRLGVDAEEASGEQLGSRGVRLMTIHGAKGLEWPVVLLPELGRAFDQRDLSGRVHAAVGEEGLEVACAPADDDGEEAVGLAAGLIADRKRRRLLAEESRLWYVACTRAREELHALVAGELPLGPRHDGSVDCYADWLVGAGTAWTDQAIDLDAPVVRAEPAEAGAEPLPPLTPPAGAETPLAAVTALVGDDGEAPAGAGLRRSTAQALGTAIHEALERFEPGMSLAQAEGALAPFAGELDPHRRQRLVARLTDRDLLPGFKDAVVRLAEQPVIGERDGMLVHGQCDLLLKDAAGAWRLYDWKTGAAASDAAAGEQLRLYAELVAPHLDGPLVEAALVDVETGRLTSIPL